MARKVSVTEFKRLLYNIHDRRPDVRIRLRILGRMWGEGFCSVNSVNDEGATFLNEPQKRYERLVNFVNVIQFELECSFFGYQAFYHYDVSHLDEAGQVGGVMLQSLYNKEVRDNTV